MDLEITQMQETTHIFHLLHHRNKNQHRHSKWWKWFSLLKRCVSRLIQEVQARDNLRVQARLEYMNQVLLPRCYLLFTQLIQDRQFSTLGLILAAELSRIRSLVGPSNDRTGNYMDPVAELVDSRDTFPLNLSEDVGESVGRTTSSIITNVETHPVFAFDIVTGPERGRDAAMGFQKKEGTGLDCTLPATAKTEFAQPKSGASIAGLKSYALSAPFERQKQRKTVSAIDELFQGLD